MLRHLGWSQSFPLPDELRHASNARTWGAIPRFQDKDIVRCYKSYWQTVKEKHRLWAYKRHTQIEALATTVNQSPSYVKKSSDPGLDARPNQKHIVENLERSAQKYRDDLQYGRFVRRRSYLFRYNHLPIVPLDQHLKLFIETLAQFPIRTPGQYFPKQILLSCSTF